MEEEKKETQKKGSDGFGCFYVFLLCLVPIAIIIIVTVGTISGGKEQKRIEEEKKEAAAKKKEFRRKARLAQPILRFVDSLRAAHPKYENNAAASRFIYDEIEKRGDKQVGKPFTDGEGLRFVLFNLNGEGEAVFVCEDERNGHMSVECKFSPHEAEKLEEGKQYRLAGTCENWSYHCLLPGIDNPEELLLGFCYGRYTLTNVQCKRAY